MGRFRNVVTAVLIVGMATVPAWAAPAASSSPAKPSPASSAKSGSLSAADKQFMVKEAEGGLGEIEMGKYAMAHGSSSQVKEFGKRLVADHTAANQKLKAIAAKYHVTLPAKLDAEHQKAMKKIDPLSGKKFDQAWTGFMVEDHRKDLEAFQKEEQTTKNADLKAFARDTGKVIAEHLAIARRTLQAVGNVSPGTSKSGTPAKSSNTAGTKVNTAPSTAPK